MIEYFFLPGTVLDRSSRHSWPFPCRQPPQYFYLSFLIKYKKNYCFFCVTFIVIVFTVTLVSSIILSHHGEILKLIILDAVHDGSGVKACVQYAFQ